jgi:hypothetical protein
MAGSSPPRLPITGPVAADAISTFPFFTPVGLGIAAALFGVVSVSGAALVVNSVATSNSTVDVAPTADVAPSPTAREVAGPEIPGTQTGPASIPDETLANDIAEATEPPSSAEAASSTDFPDATEPTTPVETPPVEVASSADLPEDAPTDASENEAVAERAEDKAAENPEEPSEVPAANQRGTVAKILPTFTLPRGASTREILLIKNVRSDQIEGYQLKCFIAGVADDYEFSESPMTGSEVNSWVELAPDPVQDEIALLTLSIRKASRRLSTRKVRITHRIASELKTSGVSFFEVHLNLQYSSSRKELSLVINQVLSYPKFSELNGSTLSGPEAYYFDKFDKTYSRELTRWDTTIRNGIKNLPGEIAKVQSRINGLRNQKFSKFSANDYRADNARRSLNSKADALSRTIPVLERRLINYRTVAPWLIVFKAWYAKAHDDIDYLVEHLRIDFDLERQDANGPAVTLVSTRGGN